MDFYLHIYNDIVTVDSAPSKVDYQRSRCRCKCVNKSPYNMDLNWRSDNLNLY